MSINLNYNYPFCSSKLSKKCLLTKTGCFDKVFCNFDKLFSNIDKTFWQIWHLLVWMLFNVVVLDQNPIHTSKTFLQHWQLSIDIFWTIWRNKGVKILIAHHCLLNLKLFSNSAIASKNILKQSIGVMSVKLFLKSSVSNLLCRAIGFLWQTLTHLLQRLLLYVVYLYFQPNLNLLFHYIEDVFFLDLNIQKL